MSVRTRDRLAPEAADPSEQLIAALEAQHEQIRRLEVLADRQAALIEQRQVEPLLGLLGERQSIIDSVRQGQAQIGELSERFSQAESTSDSARKRIEGLIAEINTGLATVMDRDEKDEDALRVARDAVHIELSDIGTARQAKQAYQARADQACRFADKRG